MLLHQKYDVKRSRLLRRTRQARIQLKLGGYCWGKDNPVPQEAGKKTRQGVQTWRWARHNGPGYVDGLRRVKEDSEVIRKVPEDLRR